MRIPQNRHYGEGRNPCFIITLFIVWIAAFVAMTAGSAHAAEKPDLSHFSAWPILHEGRIKTVESFANAVFYKISGDTGHENLDATQWLAVSLFDPTISVTLPVIEIKRSPILGITERTYVSMNQAMELLAPHQDMLIALEAKDPATLSAPQKDMLKTYEAVSIYNQIIQSFSAVLPLKGQDTNYRNGGGTRAQRALIAAGGADNMMVRFIPQDNPSMPMISLWQAVLDNTETPIINDIETMAAAWNNGDYTAWTMQSETIKTTLQNTVDVSWQFELEHIYVTTQPMLWVMGLYVLGAILILARQQTPSPLPLPEGEGNKAGLFSKIIHSRMGEGLLSGAFCISLIALVSRSLIMMRPPTGTLYETLLFGAAIIMLVGLCLRKNTLFLGVCALSAAFILFISRGFIQGESLNVLVSVLKTNFWLSTHVTCIIIGYAFCVMAAMAAHVYLFNNAVTLEKLLVPLTLAALLFTSVGTLLGGIWADQSWGRFWGWDPKENGALLIVLWLAWILHGRISGHFRKIGFAAALGLTNIMVALTWFGVNLLGVGLHSYGFISGIAWGLGSFIAIQIIAITALYFYARKKHHV